MKAQKHIEDRDWELLAKSLFDDNQVISTETPEIDPNEIRKIQEMVKKVDLTFELKKYPAEQAWGKIAPLISSKPKQNKVRSLVLNPFIRVAAAVFVTAVLLVTGYKTFYTPKLEINSGNQIVQTFMLPDGSIVSLNTNSKIKYPANFRGATREVSLEGEAFFQVKPNHEKPFVIHAKNAQVKVLGTSFNVEAYPVSNSLNVSVETGSVQLINNNSKNDKENEVVLSPGEKGTIDLKTNTLIKLANNNPNYLAWKTRNLIFKATALSEVIENLKKVYNVDIRIVDPELNDLLLTAQFNDYSLSFVLKVIESTFAIEAKLENGKYIIKARPVMM